MPLPNEWLVSAAREQVLVLALLSHALLGSFAADIQLGNGLDLHHAVTQPDESLPQHVAGQEGKRSRPERWPGLGTSAWPAPLGGLQVLQSSTGELTM